MPHRSGAPARAAMGPGLAVVARSTGSGSVTPRLPGARGWRVRPFDRLRLRPIPQAPAVTRWAMADRQGYGATGRSGHSFLRRGQKGAAGCSFRRIAEWPAFCCTAERRRRIYPRNQQKVFSPWPQPPPAWPERAERCLSPGHVGNAGIWLGPGWIHCLPRPQPASDAWLNGS